jgi:hypothetical protein
VPEPAVLVEKPAKSKIFESEEYIVYRLHRGETPVALAEKFLGDTKRSWVIEDANEEVPFETDKMIVSP